MMAADLDETICKQMSSLVELLTTSGKPTLNPEIMKKFKKLCRTSDLYVEHAFVLLMSQLEVDHAEVRLSTYQIMAELFMRSHMFRELILADFDTFLELTTGTDKKKPLPLPKAVAQNMKNSVFKSVQIWYDNFGAAYKKLELGYEFLKSFQKVDFDRIQADLELDRRQREENERKLEEARTEKLRKVDQEIMESEVEMQLSLTVVENGIQLLLPHPDDFFIPVQDEPGFSQESNECSSCDGNFMKDTKEEHTNGNLLSDDKFNDKDGQRENSCESKTVESDFHRAKHKQSCSPSATGSQSSTNDRDMFYSGIHQTHSAVDAVDKSEADDSDNDNEMEDVGEGTGDLNKEHGILDPTFSLTVTVGPASTNLQETEDNTDLIQGVRDQYRLIKTKYMPLVKKWIQVLEDNNAKEQKKMQVAELKSKLEEAMKKCVELEISSFSHRKHQESDSDDDDDGFEEVPDKEGYEDDIPEHVKLEAEMASTSKSSKKSSKEKSEKKPKRKKKPMNASTKKIKQMASELVMSQRLLAKDDIDSAMLRSKQHKSAQHCLQVDHKSVQDLPLFHPSEQTSSKSNKNTKHQGKQTNLATSSSPCSSRSSDSSLKTNNHKDTPGCSDSKRSDTNAVTDNNSEDDSTRKSSLLEKAPVVSYGIDIEHWERPGDIKAPVKNKFEGASRFWVAEKDESETAGCSEEVASLTRRTMTYVGDFEPVKWKCRAPLGNGKLCERMDRVKCPFHGKVIGRDENGMPTNPEDFSMNNKSAVSSDSDTTSSKGKGKSSKKGKGKEKKGKYANLTDIGEKHDVGRIRLEAKIFNKSTLRRVNKALDNAAMKKLSEKFGNQFNYSLK